MVKAPLVNNVRNVGISGSGFHCPLDPLRQESGVKEKGGKRFSLTVFMFMLLKVRDLWVGKSPVGRVPITRNLCKYLKKQCVFL